MARSLRFRIGILVASLLMGASTAVVVAVWLSIYNFAQYQVERDLAVGAKVLQQVLSERESQLINSAEVLAADFGFRQAVASRDIATISSALENQGSRINADMMAILDLQGNVQVATLMDVSVLSSLNGMIKNQQIIKAGGTSLFWPIDGKAFQVVMVVVRAPKPIAIAVVGFELNQSLTQRLKKITGLDISLAVSQANAGSGNFISTIDSATPEVILQSLATKRVLPISNQRLLRSTSQNLYEGPQGNIQAFITDDLGRVFQEFNRLQFAVILVAAIATILTLFACIVFSKQLTTPLSQLVRLAKMIASGYYQEKIVIKGASREVKELFSAFDSMQTDLKNREEKILYQATRDATTGLINRQKLTEDIQAGMESNQIFTLVGFSVSNFRQINDMFGPATADKCLISLSRRLAPMVPVLARLSGGGFAAKIEGRIDDQRINILTEMARVAAEADGINVNFEIHVGIVEYPADVADAVSLNRRLDIAMDSARYAHKGIHYYQAGQEEDYVKRLKIVDDLRLSMRDHGRGLQMYYQPKMNLKTGKIVKTEALIRWIHPEQGFIPPDIFIPLAEQSGLINALTEWVIATVTKQVSSWRGLGYDIQVAINLSAQDIARKDMLDIIRHQLRSNKLKADALSFEITESEVMRQPEQAIILLQLFRDSGFELAIDDFGTGYSSLSQLKNMPVSDLKIDREFVMNLASNPEDQKIVKSTIELAHSFNLEVIAEGVENVDALKLLAEWGCEWAQGYYISRPMPAKDVTTWLDNNSVEFRENTDVG